MSISSEKFRKALHPIQINTTYFRFKRERRLCSLAAGLAAALDLHLDTTGGVVYLGVTACFRDVREQELNAIIQLVRKSEA